MLLTTRAELVAGNELAGWRVHFTKDINYAWRVEITPPSSLRLKPDNVVFTDGYREAYQLTSALLDAGAELV